MTKEERDALWVERRKRLENYKFKPKEYKKGRRFKTEYELLEIHLKKLGFDKLQREYVLNKDGGFTIFFNSYVACQFDVNAAIVFNYMSFWLVMNKAKVTKENYRDDFYWTYNSIHDMRKSYFPFLTERAIGLAVKKLLDEGILVKSTKNYNKMKQDKTRWYRIDEANVKRIFKKSSEELLNLSKGN